MDELKKYLRSHADELDLDEPGPQVWQNIQQQSQVVKKTPVVLMVARWAAAACILALAGVGVWHMIDTPKTTQPTQLAANPTTTTKTDTLAGTTHTTGAANTDPGVIAKTTDRSNIHQKPAIRNTPASVNSREALQTLHNIESSFTQVINLQRERVSKMPMYAESPEYFSDFVVQIKQIEKDEKSIKSDIAKRGMTDELLSQLINLYQQKLNTLKQLQTEMNKTNFHFKQNRGPVDSTKTYYLNL